MVIATMCRRMDTLHSYAFKLQWKYIIQWLPKKSPLQKNYQTNSLKTEIAKFVCEVVVLDARCSNHTGEYGWIHFNFNWTVVHARCLLFTTKLWHIGYSFCTAWSNIHIIHAIDNSEVRWRRRWRWWRTYNYSKPNKPHINYIPLFFLPSFVLGAIAHVQ